MYIYILNNTQKTEYLYREDKALISSKEIGTLANEYLDYISKHGMLFASEENFSLFDKNPYWIELNHLLSLPHIPYIDDSIVFHQNSFINQTDKADRYVAKLNEVLINLRNSLNENIQFNPPFSEFVYDAYLDWLLSQKIKHLCREYKYFCYIPETMEYCHLALFDRYNHTNDIPLIQRTLLPSGNDLLELLRSSFIKPAFIYHQLFLHILSELPHDLHASLDNDLDRIEPLISSVLYNEIDNDDQDVFSLDDAFIPYWEELELHTGYLSSHYGSHLYELFRMLLMIYHPNTDYEHPFWSRRLCKHNLEVFCKKYFQYNLAADLLRKCIKNCFIIGSDSSSMYVCNTINEVIETVLYVCQSNNYRLQKCAFSHPKCDNYFFKKTRQIYCPYCTEKAKKYADAHPKDPLKRVLDDYKKNRQRIINNITNVKLYNKEVSEGTYLEYITDILYLLYLSQRPEQLNGSDLEFRIALSNDDIALELKKKKIQCIIQTSNKKLKLFDEPEDGSKPYILLDYSSKDIITNSWTCENNSVSIIQEKVTWGELYKRSDEGTKNYIRDYTQKLLAFNSESNIKLNMPLSFKVLANAIGDINDIAVPEDWKNIPELHNTNSKKSIK